MSIVINNLEIEGRTEGRGLSSRKSARVATTANGVLSSAFADGQTIDGVVLATGNRILIKNQTNQVDNGVYVVQASGAPVRDVDFDEGDDVLQAFVLIEEGSKNQDTGWLCIGGGTSRIVGTDPLDFILITGDVSGQLSSTDNAIARWNGTDGYSIQNTSLLIDDSNNMTGLQYLQFSDIAAPNNPSAGQGRLYKKTGDDGIFWKPDAAGSEVDLTATGETNTMSNVGTAGTGVYKQKTGVNFELKKINAGSTKLSVTDNIANSRIDLDVVQANIDHDALLNFVANEHIDHSAVTITAGIGLSGGGDITASRTIDMDIPELTAESNVDGTTDYIVMYDASAMAHRKVLINNLPTTGGGEVNTASNVGVGGVGPFKQKVGVNLEFKNINAGSNKVTVVNDAPNNEIDIDVVPGNIDHDALLNFVANEHIDHSAVTITGGVGISGGGDLTASRVLDLSIPKLTAETIVDDTADYIAMYDASALAHRKVLLQNIRAITVKDEGINVTGTPHTALNFIGTRITATNGVSGTANVTVAMPTTTKGDLMVHNGTDDTRLGVGANNYILTADSAQATGIKWSPFTISILGRDLQQATAINVVSETSGTFVDLPDMTLTTANTGAGQYLISFAGEFTVSNSNRTVNTILNVNGVDITVLNFDVGVPSTSSYVVIAFNYVHPSVLASGIVIKVRWRVSGGAATISSRSRVLVINGTST